MAKRVNPGRMNVVLELLTPVQATDSAGYQTRSYQSAGILHANWVNVHGYEALRASELGLKESATLTVRWREDITQDVIFRRKSDDTEWEVISLDNVNGRGVWMEIKVERRVNAV